MNTEIYPIEEELHKIRGWSFIDFTGLMGFIHGIWEYVAEPNPSWCGWKQKGLVYWLHTGGWSGNESIISAMQENHIFWAMCWLSSKRGGHYKFHIPRMR